MTTGAVFVAGAVTVGAALADALGVGLGRVLLPACWTVLAVFTLVNGCSGGSAMTMGGAVFDTTSVGCVVTEVVEAVEPCALLS